MLKVGIYVPYVRNELTLSAVQLADWLLMCGFDVSIMSPVAIQAGVSSYWDKRVLRASVKSLRKLARDSTHLCWFWPDFKALRRAKLATPSSQVRKTQHFFVPTWSGPVDDFSRFAAEVDRVIWVNNDLYLLAKHVHTPGEAILLKSRLCSLISPHQPLSERVGFIDQNHLSLLAIFGRNRHWDDLSLSLQVIGRLLKNRSNLQVSMLFDNKPCRRARSQVSAMLSQHGESLSCEYSQHYQAYREAAERHDLTYLSASDYSTGSVAAMLMPSTVLVCQDIPPVSSYVSDKVSGGLLECAIVENPTPKAILNFEATFTGLSELCDSTEAAYCRLQQGSKKLRGKRFNDLRQFIETEFYNLD